VSEGQPDVFGPQVVAAIMRHMNDDHADDSVLICRSLGGQPDTVTARMSGMSPAGIEFVADVDEAREVGPREVGPREVIVVVPWSEPITERGQVRLEVVRMYHEACVALGVEARAAAEH
jgi:hypothetical protein